MGSRGPSPTPTATLRNRGSWRAGERSGEPSPPVVAPKCPSFLGQSASAEWRRIVPELLGRQTLSLGDRALLAAYCHAWGEFVEAATWVEENGAIASTPAGDVLHPQVTRGSRAVDRLMKLADRFGLSPAAKARVKSYGTEEKTNDLPSLKLAQ